MSLISGQLLSAVEDGNIKRFKDLLDQHGLHKTEGNGVVLLRRSIILKHREITILLLSSGATVNSKRSQRFPSNTPLHFAIQNSDTEIIEMLLDNNADIDAKNDKGLTPILCAIRKDNEEIVDLLLKRGAYLHYNHLARAIHISVERGLYKMTDKLLQLGAFVNSNCHSIEEFTPLHIAINKINNSSMVELLLKNGADVNSKTKEGLTPIHYASKRGDAEVIKLLIMKNADVNTRANNMFTPLHFAVQNLQREAAKCLMDHGANIDAELKSGETVLHLAVCQGSSMIVEDILKCSPDINNASNKNAINIAAKKSYRSNLEIVEHLLRYGFSVDSDNVNILLENAIESAYVPIIKHLIEHGLDLACFKKENCIFLQIAAKNNKVELAQLLLAHGADVNATDKAGKPAIYYSTEKSDVSMTKLLLSHGASVEKSPELLRVATRKVCKEIVEILLQTEIDIEATDEYGRTALHLNALNEYDGFIGSLMILNESDTKTKGEIAKLLLSMGAKANAKTNKENLTALHLACQKEFANVVEALLEYKADVNCIVKDCSPLLIAAQRGSAVILKMLIANGADINFKRTNGDTALHIVSRTENPDALKILLENGADVLSKNSRGDTPLIEASKQPNCEMVSILLQHGSPIDSQDKEGRTPLHMAALALRADIIQLLLDSGSDINILTNGNHTAYDMARYSYLQKTSCQNYDSDDEYYDHNRSYEHDEFVYYNICDIFKSHLKMLETANLYVDKGLICIDSYFRDYDFQTKCENEIENLKFQKVPNIKLSLYDILTKNIHWLTSYARNKDIIQIFELDDYKTKFPIYGPRIERNFAKACQRRLLLEAAQEFFKCYFKLPYYDCSDHILRYLNDDDLQNIINVFKMPSTVTE